MKGKIKWFNHDKGYGWIGGEDMNDYFFHISKFLEEEDNDFKLLVEGADVEFSTMTNQHGNASVDVRLVK